MRRKKKNGHGIEIIVVLLIFAVMAIANALSSANFSENLGKEIAIAEAEFAAKESENLAEGK